MNIAHSSAFGKLVNHAGWCSHCYVASILRLMMKMMDDGSDDEIGEKSRGVQARNQYAPFASGWVSNVFMHRAMGLNCLPLILYVF